MKTENKADFGRMAADVGEGDGNSVGVGVDVVGLGVVGAEVGADLGLQAGLQPRSQVSILPEATSMREV